METDTNIGLKVASKDEALWRDMLDKCDQAIRIAKADILINEEIIKLANSQLKALSQ